MLKMVSKSYCQNTARRVNFCVMIFSLCRGFCSFCTGFICSVSLVKYLKNPVGHSARSMALFLLGSGNDPNHVLSSHAVDEQGLDPFTRWSMKATTLISCDIWQQRKNRLAVSVCAGFLAGDVQCSAEYQPKGPVKDLLLSLHCQTAVSEKEVSDLSLPLLPVCKMKI